MTTTETQTKTDTRTQHFSLDVFAPASTVVVVDAAITPLVNQAFLAADDLDHVMACMALENSWEQAAPLIRAGLFALLDQALGSLPNGSFAQTKAVLDAVADRTGTSPEVLEGLVWGSWEDVARLTALGFDVLGPYALAVGRALLALSPELASALPV
jgi:hypothetical protein